MTVCLLVGLFATDAAAADPPSRARAEQPLASYLSDEDYPSEAVRNGEAGAVAFRIDVSPDGRPAACKVTSSSGSPTLDAATCRVLMERPRFVPARDSAGKAVPDQLEGRIIWRLPDDSPERPEAALTLWSTCLFGEAAKLTLSDLPPAEIVRRSYPPCAALEAGAAREIGQKAPLDELRGSVGPAIEESVGKARAVLKAEAKPPGD
ncbi:MAG TPA: energy transducer TonB [Allosphingosinicella sp.]|nr:energy transducer TonB [Allosphingosinicella sp.]